MVTYNTSDVNELDLYNTRGKMVKILAAIIWACDTNNILYITMIKTNIKRQNMFSVNRFL